MLSYIQFPTWLTPEIISGLPFRWYGLMYLLAFACTYVLFKYRVRADSLDIDTDEILNLFFWAIIGVLIGGRLLAVTVYDTTGRYLQSPWLIFWPFENGRFTGIQGMSYHGALVGSIAACVIYLRVRKHRILEWTDLMAVCTPLGYTLGRLGNFINGELYGRATAAPLGVLFPNANSIPASEPWARNIAGQVGIEVTDSSQLLNLPRHPSQLYEAFFEGIFLWVLLWFVIRRLNLFRGALTASYLIGYGVFRFFIEYFRQPDIGLGYVIRFSTRSNPSELYVSPFNFSTGQVLCALMIIAGVICWFLFRSRATVVPKVETYDGGNAPRRKLKRQ